MHVGFAENGLENLPCPSSLLLGVLVTLLPKVTIIVTCITMSPSYRTHQTMLLSSIPSSSKHHRRNIKTFIKFSCLDGSKVDALFSWFCHRWGQVSLLRPFLSRWEWGGLQVTSQSIWMWRPQHQCVWDIVFLYHMLFIMIEHSILVLPFIPSMSQREVCWELEDGRGHCDGCWRQHSGEKEPGLHRLQKIPLWLPWSSWHQRFWLYWSVVVPPSLVEFKATQKYWTFLQ